MKMPGRPLVFLTLLPALAVVADVAASVPEPDVLAAAVEPIAMPDLGAIDEAPRRELVEMHRTVRELEARPGVPAVDRAEAWGQLGRLLQAYKFPEAAETAYANSRSLRPGDHRWPYYQGLVRQARGDLEGAVAAWRRTRELAPDDLPTAIRLADALLDLGRLEAARELYLEVERVDPASAAAAWGLGRVALEAGDPAAAIIHLERVLELQPEATVVHYTLGQAHRRTGDVEAARRHLMQRGDGAVSFPDPLGLQIDRLSKGTAFQIVLAMARAGEELTDEEFLGFALAQFGDVRGTIEQLRRDIARRSEEADVTPRELGRIHFVLGGMLVDADRDAEAIGVFERALELEPGLAEARVKLGNAHARGGRMEEAVAAYSTVLDGAPERTDVRLKRAAARMEQGRFEEAIADLEEVVRREDDRVEAWVRWAGSLVALGRTGEAEAKYRAALGRGPTPREEAGARTGLAQVLAAGGDDAAAREELEKAIALDPSHLPAQLALGARLAAAGRWEEAAGQYGAVLEVRPDHVPARLAHAAALIYAGRHDAARRALEAGLEAVPGEPRIEDVLARHLAASPDRAVRDGARAVELAERVRERWPTVESAETLAMAHAEAGRFEEAIRWQQTALEELGDGDPATGERLRRHLDLYRRSIACCGE